jgi:hypothetical protein
MRKLYRGEVITVMQPDGKGGLKQRPMVVQKDSKKDDSVVTVYCTKQNDGNDEENIFVLRDSGEGKEMGLWEDTYIRANIIKIVPIEYLIRAIGKCPLMSKIAKIQDDKMRK